MDEYTTMRELGKTFDVSSHTIGRWLVEIGLRTAEKNPSQRALREYVTQISLDCGKPLFMWHQAKTIAALESAGHERKNSSL